MTDIEKRAEELYPYKDYNDAPALFSRPSVPNELIYNSEQHKLREAFIKGYSEGYEKGKEEETENITKLHTEIDKLQQLEAWKEESMEIMNATNYQELGKLMGLKLGQTIADKIVPYVKQLKAENEQLRKDVTEFAEWVSDPECYWMNDGIVWYLKLNSGGYERKTTSELYELFKVRK
jgi:uncharacterized membrane protein YgaE (UPF0421/DUF939 family)